MNMLRSSASVALAPVALVAALTLIAAPAQAAKQTLVAGQTISLPLNEETDGPTLKVTVKAADGGSLGIYALPMPGESRAERKARGSAMALDSVDGRNLVKFVRFAADDLRKRSVDQGNPRSALVAVSFSDKVRIDQGHLFGDAMKAGFTLGIAAPATTPMFFASHMDVAVEGRTYSCDAETPGRIPRYPQPKKDAHYHDALDKMAEDARKACWAQIVDKVGGVIMTPVASEAAAAPAPAPEAAPAAAVAPATPTS